MHFTSSGDWAKVRTTNSKTIRIAFIEIDIDYISPANQWTLIVLPQTLLSSLSFFIPKTYILDMLDRSAFIVQIWHYNL